VGEWILWKWENLCDARSAFQLASFHAFLGDRVVFDWTATQFHNVAEVSKDIFETCRGLWDTGAGKHYQESFSATSFGQSCSLTLFRHVYDD
jgi:plastocyanin